MLGGYLSKGDGASLNAGAVRFDWQLGPLLPRGRGRTDPCRAADGVLALVSADGRRLGRSPP